MAKTFSLSWFLYMRSKKECGLHTMWRKYIMARTIPMLGKRFGRLTVVAEAGSRTHGMKVWECLCDCGNTRIVYGTALRSGNTKSCGCLSKELLVDRNTTHGKRYTRLYSIWLNMKERCNNPNHRHYKHYGGRGIAVCDEWQRSFESFYEWSKENGYADNLSIDRRDNNIGYTPDNCRWATSVEQKNNMRSNVLVEIDGRTRTITQWAELSGVNPATIRSRYKKGIRGSALIKKP